VRRESYGKERRGRPAEQQRDWVREQSAGPSEVAPYVAIAVELGVRLGGECAGKENPEQQQDDAANLAGKRRLRRPIVPVPVRAW
jgi:hypothetical protein